MFPEGCLWLLIRNVAIHGELTRNYLSTHVLNSDTVADDEASTPVDRYLASFYYIIREFLHGKGEKFWVVHPRRYQLSKGGDGRKGLESLQMFRVPRGPRGMDRYLGSLGILFYGCMAPAVVTHLVRLALECLSSGGRRHHQWRWNFSAKPCGHR